MMKETLLITGANGFIAKHLTARLSDQYNIRLLTRKPNAPNQYAWDVANKKIDGSALKGLDHIVHLAGANIFEKRWTDERKKEIVASRVESAQLLLDGLQNIDQTIKSFVSASAIGYYGAVTCVHVFTENDPKGDDFLSEVAAKWERAADQFKEKHIAERVVKIRTAVVFAEKSPALDNIKKTVSLYVGAPLGTGRQYMPWIHVDDLCRAYGYSLQNAGMDGVYNAVAPQHITNKELTQYIAHRLRKPLCLPHVPAFVLRFLFGEAACMILEGSRVSCEKLEAAGLKFQFPALETFL